MQPAVTLTDAPAPELRDTLGRLLGEYNEQQAGYRDWRPLSVMVSDPATGQTVGGLTGRTSYGLMVIDIVYLPPELRGQGLGRRIMSMAEDEARARGCRGGVLYTITFEAPEFYERLGWAEFGRVPCDPPGHARVFMRKDFV